MDEKEFDEFFKQRNLETEISLLQYFRDIKFTCDSKDRNIAHRRGAFTEVTFGLGQVLESFPECKTFEDLAKKDYTYYELVRTQILKLVNECNYTP